MSLGRRVDMPEEFGGGGAASGFGPYGWGSFPFPLMDVGPRGQQPLSSQFVTDLETGQPAILPWGMTYADIATGAFPQYPPSRFGPPYPGISYVVGYASGGVTWEGVPPFTPPTINEDGSISAGGATSGTGSAGNIGNATKTISPLFLIVGLVVLVLILRR